MNVYYYTEVHNDFVDGNFVCIDAWHSEDDNEEGQVVAVVHKSGDVYYIDKIAERDCAAQEAIKEVLDNLPSYFETSD